MIAPFDESLLDDADRLAAGDPGQMLRTVAGSGAQVREALVSATEAGLGRLGDDGRPRAVVVTGMGGSGISGDVLAAVAGLHCPVPIVVHRGYGLPGWVGAADVVVGVSCSGGTEETLSAVEQGVARGAVVVGIGATDSPLEALVGRGGGAYAPVPGGRMPRASLWSLTVPLLLAGRALGIVSVTDDQLAGAADRLDGIAEACRPSSESFVNPAKQLALELAGSLPMNWGTSPLAGVAAYRMAGQLAENAKYPSISGVLPEANHNQVVGFDGPFGGSPADDDEDFFRDRAHDVEPTRLRLVLLRDAEEHPQITRRADASAELARTRGLSVSELRAEPGSVVERFADLVGLIDFASVYLGLGYGLDPTPIAPIAELKERISR